MVKVFLILCYRDIVDVELKVNKLKLQINELHIIINSSRCDARNDLLIDVRELYNILQTFIYISLKLNCY